jgi:hypothetical protein
MSWFRHPFNPFKPPRRVIDQRRFALEPNWPGDTWGAFYTSLGRGGKGIIKPWKICEPAVQYTANLPVNIVGWGTPFAGSYPSNPLAIPASANTATNANTTEI